MSLTSPTITSASFNMTVNPSVVTPLNSILSTPVPINFNSVANLQIFSGTFTPANNILNIATSIQLASAPNFVVLICDAQLNLTVKSGANILINSVPVNKIQVITLTPSSTYNVTDILFDGTTAALQPMTQSVAVDYTVIVGQAVIN